MKTSSLKLQNQTNSTNFFLKFIIKKTKDKNFYRINILNYNRFNQKHF
jgi:hypothetical protein